MFRFLSLLVLLFPLVTSLRFRGTVTSSNDFTYIGKFAYGNKGGVLSAVTKFWDPINQSINQSMSIFGQKLVLFPDMAGAWDTIEDINQSCEDTLKLAGKTVYNIGQTNQPIDPVTNQSTNEMKLNIWGQRPHFWYIVLANCQADPIFNTTTNQSINPSIDQSINQFIDPSTGLPIAVSVWYDFELTNAGDMWTAPLSWEQHHIAEISITFLIVYVGLLIGVLIGVCRSTASMKSTNQSMYLLLAAVLFFQILAQILSLSYQMEMIHQQSINQSINAASWWFDTFSQLLLLISVMVLSINNHAVANKIHRSQMLLIGVVMAGYLFGYIASFVVDQHHQSIDPSIDQWIFNNWGGYVLCALRICTIGVIANFITTSFNQSINQSNAPSTRSLLFYVMFASAWLASFPVITLIASMTVSYWRAKFFYGVNCIVTFTFIVCQVGLTYRNSILMKSTNFKTMSNPTSKEASRIGENVTGQMNSEVSMIDMSRSPDNSNPSSPRSPRSPSQGVRSVQPV